MQELQHIGSIKDTLFLIGLLSTGCQNELKGAVAVEKATNPGRRCLFFSRLRRSVVLPTNRHATQASSDVKYA